MGGTLLAMIDTGQADIALETEPNVSMAASQNARVVYSMTDMYKDFLFTGVAVSEKIIKDNPTSVQRFVNAISAAMAFAHQNPDKTAAFAQKRYPDTKPEIITDAVKRLLESKILPVTALVSKEAWAKSVQLRVNSGELKSLEGSFSVLDMSFAKKAAKTTKLWMALLSACS